MRLAKWIFLLAGISGLLMLLPLYFLEARMAQEDPPAINHPEYYYGFVGLCVAWQVLFLVIASDPVRFRPVMLPAMLEKASFAFAIPTLYALQRVAGRWVGFASMDALWLVLFVVAYLGTPKEVPKEAVKKDGAF
jgi:hypothetical protein